MTPTSVTITVPPVNGEPAAAPAAPALKVRAIRGSLWTTAGFGINQSLRLGANIALAWALGPYAQQSFGLMAMVTVFMAGLQMFSDVGITPALIQNKRGDDPDFYNTAWTVQVARGFILWLVACAIAYPVSLFWYPPLLYLLPVAGVAAVFNGLTSTNIPRASRRLAVGRLASLEVATQVVGVIVMILWALVHPSVWALVAGNLATAAFRMAGSYFLLPDAANRLRWDPTAARELFRFGRWITISTLLTFLAAQIDKLTFGRLLPVEALGVYWMGYQLAVLLPNLSKQLSAMVGFPALSDLFRRDVPRFLMRLRHLRAMLVLPLNTGLLVLVLLGQPLVQVIYHERFTMAGWIVQVLAVNSLAGMVNTSYGQAIMATGRTFLNMIAVAAMLVVMIVCPLTGYVLQGSTGFIMGVGISQWVLYPVYAVLAKRCGCWQPRFDVAVLIGFGLAGAAALWCGDLLTRHWFLP